MAFIDYYKILGADRYDDYNKIREARNERLKQYNSDRGNIAMGEAEKQLRDTAMKEINAAWEILGDEEKREKYNEEEYDKRFATPPRGASPNPPPGRSYQQHYTPPFTPPPPPPRTPPGGAYQQHYAPPNPPPQTPPRWGYGQSYAPPMAPAAKAKHKRNKRMLVVGGIGGGAVGGAVAIGIFAAEQASFGGGVILRLIAGAIVGAILGLIVGLIVGLISLAVIRKLAGKEALAFSGVKEAGIVTIAGIVAGAIILVTPLAGQFALLAQFALAVVVGLIAGALVARNVRK